MRAIPLVWLPLVGLLAIPFTLAFAIQLKLIAVLAIFNTMLIVVAVRIMLGSEDIEYPPFTRV